MIVSDKNFGFVLLQYREDSRNICLIRENIGRKKRKHRQIVEQPERPPTASEQKQAEMLRVQARQLTAKAAEAASRLDQAVFGGASRTSVGGRSI